MVPIALSIAGSDPSGGAGIQADLKTFSALGAYGAAVVTALTAQNTAGVSAVHLPPASFLRAQLDAVLADLRVDAAKTGMLGSAEIVEAVAERLERRRLDRLVVDPVLLSKGGAALLLPEAVAVLRARLLPLARVLTPNLPEAAVLLGEPEAALLADPAAACRRLLALGPGAVVLKGGHAGGATSDDWYRDGREFFRLTAPRCPTRNTHGTGCTFAAAITAGLARGLAVPEAVRRAKEYVTAALAQADRLGVGRGEGHGPVHHFHAWWDKLE